MPGLLNGFVSEQPTGGGLLGQDAWSALGLIGAGMTQGRGGFGRGAASAIEYLDGAKQRRLQEQLGLLNIRKGTLEVDDLERKTAEEKRAAEVLRNFYGNNGAPQAPKPAFGGPTGMVNSALPPDLQIGALPAVSGYQAPPAGGVAPKSAVWQQYQTMGQQLAQAGLGKQAQAYFELAEKHRPKMSQTPQIVRGPDGKLVNVLIGDDGSTQVMPFGVKPEIELKDTGGEIVPVDKNDIGPGFKLPKTGNPFSDLVLRAPGGAMVPNSPLVGVKKDIAKSGASNTSIKVENKMGESLAAQVGPMIKESWTAANGAVDTIDASNRIIAAADSGKLFAGPGANARLKIAQVSQVLGIGGKDEAERIANTRQTIRGLAEMTLQGRKLMTGQGAITEKESLLAERAQSGDIADLTVPEIKQLANASARAARFVYDQHGQMVNQIQSNPNTQGLAPFYKPRPIPSSPRMLQAPQQGAAQPGPGARFLGFE